MESGEAGRVLVVDDQPHNVALLADLLRHHGYRVATARDVPEAEHELAVADIDVVLLDIRLPGLSGVDWCRALKSDPRHADLPIVLVTALDPRTEKLGGLEAGADDFLSKPVHAEELLARVRTLVRSKRLHDQTRRQAAELATMNAELERRVADKVAEIERLARLKRFVGPQLAERLVAADAPDPLVSHRRDIVVVFFDLRGFTAFSESHEPEDVMGVLAAYHAIVGEQTLRYSGTIERYAGDGIMVIFNDPAPVDAPCEHTARFVLEVMAECRPLFDHLRRTGFALDVSAGMAYGYATLGAIGYGDRIDYGAIGSVTNLAARLCAEAPGGVVLGCPRVAAALPPSIRTEPTAPLTLKGFRDPVAAVRLVMQ